MKRAYTLDYIKEITLFPFQDKKWVAKFFIGSLVLLMSLVLLFLPSPLIFGYLAELERGIIVDNKKPYLPEWGNLTSLYKEGIRVVLSRFGVAIPFLGFFVIGQTLIFTNLGNRSEFALLVLTVLFSSLMIFSFAFVLSMSIILPAAFLQVVVDRKFSSLFNFTKWWAIFRANIAGFVLAYFFYFLISNFVIFINQLLFLTIVFACVFPFVLFPVLIYLYLISSVLSAHAYKDGLDALQAK